MKTQFLKTAIWFILFVTGIRNGWGQTSGDYRSFQSGDWSQLSSWETYNGTSWISVTSSPAYTNGTITISSGHTIAVTSNIDVDQLIIKGILLVSGTPTITVWNGTGDDININNGGIITFSPGTSGGWSFNAYARLRIMSGGTYIHNSTRSISTPLDYFILDAGSEFKYRGSSTLSPAVSISGRTYENLTFESSSGTWATSFTSGSNTLSVNGKLTIGSNVTWGMGSFTGSLNFNGDIDIYGNFTPNSFTVATGKSMTIFSGGKLTIPAMQFVTVNGALSNNAGSSGLSVKSSSSGTGSLITSTSSLNATIERFIPVISASKYHYISSPITGAYLSSILDGTLGHFNAYYYDPSISGSINSKWVRAFPWDTMKPGIGYIIPYQSSSITSKIISFSGTVNTGALSPSISSVTNDWNLVGNPYPCGLSADDFITENTANNSRVFGTLYFWDDDASGGSGYSSGDYSSWNGTGHIGNAQTPDGYIGTSQAFFVQSQGGSSTISFNNSMKRTNNTQFFIVETAQIQRLKLGIMDENSNYNEILIGFLPEATQGFDPLYDGRKLKGNSALSLYTFITNDTNYVYAIQGLPRIIAPITIRLGIDANLGGNYVFSVKNMENFSAEKIFLKDLKNNIFVDLTIDSQYIFYSEKGLIADRFLLLFVPGESNIMDENKTDEYGVKIYNVKKSICIKNNSTKPDKLKINVYDLAGKEVFKKNSTFFSPAESLSIDLLNGFYLVKVIKGNTVQTEKIIIR